MLSVAVFPQGIDCCPETSGYALQADGSVASSAWLLRKTARAAPSAAQSTRKVAHQKGLIRPSEAVKNGNQWVLNPGPCKAVPATADDGRDFGGGTEPEHAARFLCFRRAAFRGKIMGNIYNYFNWLIDIMQTKPERR